MDTTTQQTNHPTKPLPVVLACAGGTPLARLSYDLAVTLEKDGIAEMVCLLNLDNTNELNTLKGRELIVIDGCSRQCVKAWLAKQSLQPTYYFDLSDPLFELQPASNTECTIKDMFHVLNLIHQKIPSAPMN